MKDSDPTDIVEKGYETIARAYHEQRDQFKNHDLLRPFTALLAPGGEVLDAGCGAGIPVARFLVDAGFSVTGVDISSAMLELARQHAPLAYFIKMDMRQLAFDKAAFDGISAFYSLFHIPRTEHAQVFVDFYRLLRPGGVLLLCSGVESWQGVGDFHGSPMYWSHPDGEVTRQLVVDAGFSVLLSEAREYGGERHYWIMARKSE